MKFQHWKTPFPNNSSISSIELISSQRLMVSSLVATHALAPPHPLACAPLSIMKASKNWTQVKTFLEYGQFQLYYFSFRNPVLAALPPLLLAKHGRPQRTYRSKEDGCVGDKARLLCLKNQQNFSTINQIVSFQMLIWLLLIMYFSHFRYCFETNWIIAQMPFDFMYNAIAFGVSLAH